jgi:hypothetical protein
MPTIDELFSALEKADAAGNKEDAKQLADWIREEQSRTTPAKPSEPAFEIGGEEFSKMGEQGLSAIAGSHDPLKFNVMQAVLSNQPLSQYIREATISALPTAAKNAIAAVESQISKDDVTRVVGRAGSG